MMKTILVPTINSPVMKSTFETALLLTKRTSAYADACLVRSANLSDRSRQSLDGNERPGIWRCRLQRAGRRGHRASSDCGPRGDEQRLGSGATCQHGQAGEAVLKTETLDAVADRGYFNSPEILACHEAGITVTLPKPMTSGAKAEGRFGKQDFAYLPEEDAYRCRAGEQLPYRYMTEDAGALLDHSLSNMFTQIPMHAGTGAADYTVGARASARSCAAAPRCKSRGDAPAARDSRTSVWHDESPYGGDALPHQTLPKVASVLAQNPTRVMKIVGIKLLIAAIAP